MRPTTTGRDAVKEMLDYLDPLLSETVDDLTEELNFRQRDRLRRQILKYLIRGIRQRSKDRVQQQMYEYIIINYVRPEENFKLIIIKKETTK